MIMPENVAYLCQQFVTNIRFDPDHSFSEMDRLKLLMAFNPRRITTFWDEEKQMRRLILAEGSRALGWLALITANHVFPVWEQAKAILNGENKKSDLFQTPQHMLTLAQGLLQGSINFDDVAVIRKDDFYYAMEIIPQETTEHLFCAATAADAALSIVCGGLQSKTKPYPDFALIALKAYAGLDNNTPGEWLKVKTQNTLGEQIALAQHEPLIEDNFTTIAETGSNTDFENFWAEYVENEQRLALYTPMIFDNKKVLEYWEWWLMEAIPQAWSMVESN